MKTLAIILVLIVLTVLALFFASALIVGQPISEAAAVRMLHEPTPLEGLEMMRESRRPKVVFNPFVLLLIGIVFVVAFLSMSDKGTKFLRALKGVIYKPQPKQTQMQDTPMINIGQLPNSAPVPLPARTSHPHYLEVDSNE